MKNKIKSLLKYIITFFVLILSFSVLLTIVSLIPKSAIENKTVESAEILTKQTNRLMVKIPSKRLYMMFDNFTDALMINTAYSIDNETPFYSAMVARKNYLKGITTTIFEDTKGELKSSSKYKELDQVGDLNDTVNNDTTESFEYARYWHGYLIFLRPLLTVLNVIQIRIVLAIVLGGLGAVLLYLLWKNVSKASAIIFILGMFVSDYLYMCLSLQGAPVFIIMMIASILIASKKIKEKNYPMLFFLVGMCTNFFDFLTVPIITLCIPLIVSILLKQKDGKLEIKESMLMIIKLSFFWGLGYVGTWIAKWIIVDLVYGKHIIKSAIDQILYRSVSSEATKKYTLIDAFSKNFNIVKIPFVLSLFLTFVLVLIKIIRADESYKFVFKKEKVIPYFVITLIPIAWYTVLANHSYLHIIFTYRNFFAITVGLLITCYNLTNFEKKSEEENK